MEGNQVALSGLFSSLTFYGVYDAEKSTISFAPQYPYGETEKSYIFCTEKWDDEGYPVYDADAPVVATISEDGKIAFNDWTILYDYGDDSYYIYFCYIETALSKAAAEGDASAICGTYNVEKFSGYESYWFSTSTNWNAFSYDDYEVTITLVEGNQVALNGLFSSLTFYGEYDAATSTISFAPQYPYGETEKSYIFCTEKWDDEGYPVYDADAPVVATISEDGKIAFNDWTILYDYGDDSYYMYFCYIETTLAKVESEGEAPAICGTYNVDKFSGYESYWFSTSTNWTAFSYDEYEVTITQVEGDKVALNNLFSSLSFYGVYNETESTITFAPQYPYGDTEKSYIFCTEKWDDEGYPVYDPETPVVAVVTEDGKIQFNGWTILYDYGDDSYYMYFCYTESTLSPKTDGINNAIADEVVDGPAEYYNLQGIRVNENDAHNGLFIVRQGNKVTKRIIK